MRQTVVSLEGAACLEGGLEPARQSWRELQLAPRLSAAGWRTQVRLHAEACATFGRRSGRRLLISRVTCSVVSLLWLAALAQASFDPAHWKYRRPLGACPAGEVCTATLDRTIYAGSATDLRDLRVVRNGQEVPYIVETRASASEEREMQPEILDRSVVPGEGLQFTLDAGKAAKHNRLRISTDMQNFRTRVRIETSPDGHQWMVAREDGYIFDFSQGGRSFSVLTVDYPVSTRRYVRATLFGWTRPDALKGAWLLDYQEHPSIWQTVAESVPARTEKDQTSLLVLDLGAASLPHSRLRFVTSAAAFQRACDIESSTDREHWGYVSQGVIYRYPDGETAALTFPEQHARYLRLRIYNGDDRPVPIDRVMFDTLERRLKFIASAPDGYLLYYGNPEAKTPTYDLAAILARRAPALEDHVTAGPQQPNPAYVPPAQPLPPWSERHPGVLYGTLAVAILGMGYVTVRFLMSVKRPPQP